MLKAIAQPRAELSPYAPKMVTTTIPVDKISEVIGKSGKAVSYTHLFIQNPVVEWS